MLRLISGIAALAIGLAPVVLDPGRAAAPLALVSLPPATLAGPIGGIQATRFDGVAQFPKWTDMLRRWSEQIGAARHCIAITGAVEGCVPAEWSALTAQLRPLGRRAMLDRLNRAINRHRYVAATDNWGRADYWETPFEFMSRDGQCEDYAIAKFMILRALGFDDDDLRILVVRDVARQIDHAVLVVYLDGTAWLLDSIDDTVAPLASATRYRPYYAINETGWWLYAPNPVRPAMARVTR
ncbi:MAG TPA: transglutaminase-like cysteine peptidase [Stellaceae bacterium]|nr:transglutaminase-like cysteine peptidase [Stellaceae bacterium]